VSESQHAAAKRDGGLTRYRLQESWCEWDGDHGDMAESIFLIAQRRDSPGEMILILNLSIFGDVYLILDALGHATLALALTVFNTPRLLVRRRRCARSGIRPERREACTGCRKTVPLHRAGQAGPPPEDLFSFGEPLSATLILSSLQTQSQYLRCLDARWRATQSGRERGFVSERYELECV